MILTFEDFYYDVMQILTLTEIEMPKKVRAKGKSESKPKKSSKHGESADLLPAEGVMQILCIEANKQNIQRYRLELSISKEGYKTLFREHDMCLLSNCSVRRDLHDAINLSQADVDHMTLQVSSF